MKDCQKEFIYIGQRETEDLYERELDGRRKPTPNRFESARKGILTTEQ